MCSSTHVSAGAFACIEQRCCFTCAKGREYAAVCTMCAAVSDGCNAGCHRLLLGTVLMKSHEG